jgi:adenylate kinase family enzyme
MAEPDGSPAGRRIVVVGGTGTGKSTLAETLAGRLGVPFVELDALFWRLPDWQEPDPDEFVRLVEQATEAERWVVAGNYETRLQALTWDRADQVIWLDYPLRVSFWRLLRRTIGRWRRNELLWGTNRESLWEHFFTRRSLLLWSLTSFRRVRRRNAARLSDPRWGHVDIRRMRSQKELDAWLSRLPPGEVGDGAQQPPAPQGEARNG